MRKEQKMNTAVTNPCETTRLRAKEPVVPIGDARSGVSDDLAEEA